MIVNPKINLAIIVALFVALAGLGAHGQSIGFQGISSVQGKTAAPLQIIAQFDPTSVAPGNFPGSSNITEAQFKAAVAESIATLQSALHLKITTYFEFFWIGTGGTFGGCTLNSVEIASNCAAASTSAMTWANYRAAIHTLALSTNAITAYNNLPVSNPLPGGVSMQVPTVQQIAFGLTTTAGPAASDCQIAVKNSVNWTPTQNGGAGPIAAGTFDLVGDLIHEETECMNRFRWASTGGMIFQGMDPMSYSAPGVLNLSFTGTMYFSVDGGVTNINTFNQNINGDFGDWSGLTPDSFNAFNTTGQLNPLSAGDIKAVDALGYQCGSC